MTPLKVSDPYKYVLQLLLKNFPFSPTKGQQELLSLTTEFIIKKYQRQVFIIKGYAGTGKTTLVKALTGTLPQLKHKAILLAPTGRAAKVLSDYSGNRASTIHRHIYRFYTSSTGVGKLIKVENKYKHTLFIVDEASMIGHGEKITTQEGYGSYDLLTDLIQYVYSGENCRLIFIGDTAQLPPVGMVLSHALNSDYLETNYDLGVVDYELTEVIRQKSESGILYNATQIRNNISYENYVYPKINNKDYFDVERLDGYSLEDALNSSYSSDIENVITITKSNKKANKYNMAIRSKILYREEQICTSDLMMVVKNNYFWTEEYKQLGFIANGDIIEIQRIYNFEEKYGYNYADAQIRMIDYLDSPILEVKLLLDVINLDSASMSFTDMNKLFFKIMADEYGHIKNKAKRAQMVRESKYFNALQVKFAYAITCHKAQGGQWDTIFIDQGYVGEEQINQDYLRWLYTGVSRAKNKLYLINFKDEFFE